LNETVATTRKLTRIFKDFTIVVAIPI